jgi:large subunit ribosomal protein L22
MVASVAKLKNIRVTPQKARRVIEMVRGKRVAEAMNILRFNAKKESAHRLEKLLRSAIANWEQKNEGARIEDAELYIKTIFVDGGAMAKRVMPAPQGRAYRKRKRSNHVTLIVDSKVAAAAQVETSNTTNE